MPKWAKLVDVATGATQDVSDSELGKNSRPSSGPSTNPDWGIQTGPTWAPDFRWFLMWDGTRLLLTTVDDPTATGVLASEAFGGAHNYDVPTFSITERDYPGN